MFDGGPKVAADVLRIAIHGSCVTRDIFSRPYASHIAIEPYIARHSIVSAMSEPLPGLPGPDTDYGDRPWRTRMGRCDAAKELAPRLRAGDADWLVIDLIDEQLTPARLEGTLVTMSEELREYLESIGRDVGEAVLLGRRETLRPSYWMPAMRRYTELIRSLYAPERVIVHTAYRVNRYRTADGVRMFGRSDLRENLIVNTMLAARYRALIAMLPGCQVVRHRGARADDAHRWGLATYHYDETYYRSVFDSIDAVVSARCAGEYT